MSESLFKFGKIIYFPKLILYALERGFFMKKWKIFKNWQFRENTIERWKRKMYDISFIFPFLVLFFAEFYEILCLYFVAFLVFGRASDFTGYSRAIYNSFYHSSKEYRSLPQILGHPREINWNIIAEVKKIITQGRRSTPFLFSHLSLLCKNCSLRSWKDVWRPSVGGSSWELSSFVDVQRCRVWDRFDCTFCTLSTYQFF